METLFSFEILVDNIQVDRGIKLSDELAVALRLLDFPTLIIYQPENRKANVKEGEYGFHRGKACFFKVNVDSLHKHLTRSPLYVMVLDVKEEMPKLVGNAYISLTKVMHRIRQDVAGGGMCTPSSHGQRGTVNIVNLKGEKVGTISLSYKLLSLGSSLLPHVHKCDSKNTEEIYLQENKEVDELSENVHKSNPDEGGEIFINKDATNQDISNHHEMDSFVEETSVFCPPHMYYNNSAEERTKYEEESVKELKSHLDAFASGDAEDETGKNMYLKEQKDKEANSGQPQVSSDVTPNVIGQAIRQMPLLNALLVELSQLHSPNSNQPLSVHPTLAWIYGPASAETPAVGRSVSPRTQIESNKTRTASPRFKHLHLPKKCSTPTEGERRSTSRKKLVYGTTRSFNLRLKQNSPASGKQRVCENLIKGKTPFDKSKSKSKVVNKLSKSPQRPPKESYLTENIETMIQSLTTESAQQETLGENPSISDAASPIESPCRHFPANSESNNSPKINQSTPDSHAGRLSGSSHSSVDSVVSDRSGGEDEYADDFNSFEPSDAYSPDHVSSSPELQRPKTPKSFSDLGRFSDSSPENVQKNFKNRPVIPVPIKASRSPQRALRGTYTVQRQIFGVSFSSEDGDRASSELPAYSGRLVRDSSQEERSSRESLPSSGDHRSGSDKSRLSLKRSSNESSLEHKMEEDDELGTLDFRQGYKNISELVAHKLPGYTM